MRLERGAQTSTGNYWNISMHLNRTQIGWLCELTCLQHLKRSFWLKSANFRVINSNFAWLRRTWGASRRRKVQNLRKTARKYNNLDWSRTQTCCEIFNQRSRLEISSKHDSLNRCWILMLWEIAARVTMRFRDCYLKLLDHPRQALKIHTVRVAWLPMPEIANRSKKKNKITRQKTYL